MEPQLALQGVFAHLVRKGLPLGVRDYMDALAALRAGHGLHDRESLCWLCETLWARTESETRLIRLLFQQFPRPSPEDVAAVVGQPESEPERAASASEAVSDSRLDKPSKRKTDPKENIAVEFAPPSRTGLGLPRAGIGPPREEIFILDDQPPISLRNLVIIWRRFRRPLREGPRVDLDMEATIAAQCRTGVLAEPSLVPARRNQARLTVLIDASESMRPWHHFNETITASLLQGQLKQIGIYYFHNAPEDVLYRDSSMTRPVRLDAAFREQSECALLILSDAGAVRGVRDPNRVSATRHFLDQVYSQWRPVVWVNPMPRRRWRRAIAAELRRERRFTMVELTEEDLVRAVDMLRGRH